MIRMSVPRCLWPQHAHLGPIGYISSTPALPHPHNSRYSDGGSCVQHGGHVTINSVPRLSKLDSPYTANGHGNYSRSARALSGAFVLESD